MLGAIGHDLRSPLTALRIRAENLPVLVDTRRMIALIDHLSHMLNAIIGLAKVGHDPEPPVPTDIVALATAIVEEFEDLGNDVRLLPSLPIVHALRPHLFMQLLRNIVDNAVKYGQRARLRLNQADGTLFIRVEDDGPGIDPADIERLMKPFERLESSRNRETGGTGLGLAMARIITGMHDAALSFDKIDGQAFAVTIRVPAGAPRAQTESR
jgi:signal transduction histidine kinase